MPAPDQPIGDLSQTLWQRHDWQKSLLAPGLHCLQALSMSHKTASGAGFTQEQAYLRCLGETAEILALETSAGAPSDIVHSSPDLPADAVAQAVQSSEGVAAGPSIDFAAFGALRERLERWAIHDWWTGKLSAEKLSTEWCQASGLGQQLAKLRLGARLPRRTGYWHLPGFELINVAICQSTDPVGNLPILGFGADINASKAVQSALIEMCLMEFNVLDLLAHQAGRAEIDVNNIVRVISNISQAQSRLLPITVSPGPDFDDVELSLADRLDRLSKRLIARKISFALQDITRRGTGLRVVRAILPDAPGMAILIRNNHGPMF